MQPCGNDLTVPQYHLYAIPLILNYLDGSFLQQEVYKLWGSTAAIELAHLAIMSNSTVTLSDLVAAQKPLHAF